MLCQQQFDSGSVERLQRFRDFLVDRTQAKASEAEAKLKAKRLEFGALITPTQTEIIQSLAELIATSPQMEELSKLISTFCLQAERMRLSVSEGDCPNSALDAGLPDKIQEAIAGLDLRRAALERESLDSDALIELSNEHSEILDRKVCAEALPGLKERLRILRKIRDLRKCKSQCATTAISRKSSALRDAHLTEDFASHLKKEIEFLGLGYLPIKVEGRSAKGASYIGAALSKTGRDSNSRILSEGEFRGLALACFLAEVTTIPGRDGIVIDDPVSSLDHLHVEQIALRLVKEAEKRQQVIVFTHDLGFYYALWVAASEAQVPVLRNWIYRDGSKGFGKVAFDDGPWQVKKVKERYKFLEVMLQDMPDQATSFPPENLERTEAFYSKLRETWERLVEECLLNDVVGRFQPGVSTQSLKGVNVSDEDYKRVFFAMKRASEFSGHDRAAGRIPQVRTIDEMRNDLGELWSYERELRARREALERQRRALEVPPKADVSVPGARERSMA
ncbi:AAA family ATPase [Terriglobus roseus]|uniref:AAA family ATPase n=1 Tax=Terriglobus roseus TaxID=392734 RepID=UPI000941F5DA|nr:AAA family ATPase [Terriglobus roseus]